jgi:NADH dehydrogenase
VTYEDQSGKQTTIASKTVLWAGGVTATNFGRVLAERTGAKTTRQGHIEVLPDLTLPGYPEIFVVGDLAAAKQPDGRFLPGVAQVAMQGGKYAAQAIVARLKGDTSVKPFHYFDKGDLAVIGRGRAVARIFGVHLAGLPAWLVWLFVHLMYLVQFRSRILVFVQWGLEYLSFNRGALLITGNAQQDKV